MLKKPLKKNNETNTKKNDSIDEEIEEDIEVEDEVDDIEDSDDVEEELLDLEDDIEDDIEETEDEEDIEEIEEEEEIEDDETADLFTVIKEKRKSELVEGDYIGIITEVLAERRLDGKYGKPWVSIGLKFKIKNRDTGKFAEVTFNANKSLDMKSRLYPIVKGILGAEPGDNFNLKELEGKKAKISIEHNTDTEGNVWDNIVAARKYIPKKK